MAALKSSISLSSQASLLLLLIISLAGLTKLAQSQECATQIDNLNICAPYVVPGASSSNNPSAECCNAIQSVQPDCLCNTLRIVARLPSYCNVPQFNCST